MSSAVDGAQLHHDLLSIVARFEEDGELKVANFKGSLGSRWSPKPWPEGNVDRQSIPG